MKFLEYSFCLTVFLVVILIVKKVLNEAVFLLLQKKMLPQSKQLLNKNCTQKTSFCRSLDQKIKNVCQIVGLLGLNLKFKYSFCLQKRE